MWLNFIAKFTTLMGDIKHSSEIDVVTESSNRLYSVNSVKIIFLLLNEIQLDE
jgi:hypothetical protein